MKVIEQPVATGLGDKAFSLAVKTVQAGVIQHLDRLRKPERTPYSGEFVEKMGALGIDMRKIGWKGAMTFLPYRAEYLIRQIESKPPKRLLEVGAGSSTLLFSALAHKYGFEVVSLENHGGTVDYVDYLLEGTPFAKHVCLQICGFKRCFYPDGKAYWWYAADLSGAPFDFVFVDGPMSSLVGRNGALPQAMPYLAAETRVFVDDVNREHEKAALQEWKHYFPEIQVDEECPGLGRVLVRR